MNISSYEYFFIYYISSLIIVNRNEKNINKKDSKIFKSLSPLNFLFYNLNLATFRYSPWSSKTMVHLS